MTNTQFTVLVVAALAMAVVAAFIGTWLYLRDRDDESLSETYDDYFSDIQDAIKDEDEGQMEGQQKLWETGQMPVVGEHGPELLPLPASAAVFPTSSGDVPYCYVSASEPVPAPELDAYADSYRDTPKLDALVAEHVGPPAAEWWEDKPQDAVQSPAPVPSVEAEEDIDSTFIRDFKADLEAWAAEQEAIRQQWRKENGLDPE